MSDEVKPGDEGPVVIWYHEKDPMATGHFYNDLVTVVMANDPESQFGKPGKRERMVGDVIRTTPASSTGRFPERQPEGITAPFSERQAMQHIALALIHIRQQLDKIPRLVQDQSRPFDSYTPQSVGESETTIVVQPSYDMDEIVTSFLITGPPGAVTLQLGDRIMALTIPASGIINVGPTAIRLSRNDARTLTAATPGQYNVELMGFGDNVRGI